MSDIIRTSIGKKIEEFVIGAGANLPSSPIDVAKLGFQIIKDKKEETFLNEVLNEVTNVTAADINAIKSLERLYKSLQVIAKATTQDKITRFKNLTINGIISQNELSDNNYELYLRLIDELTDEEFIYLNSLVKNLDRTLNFNNDSEENKELISQYEKANELIKLKLELSDEKLDLYRNTLAGKGLVNLQAAWGGLAFKNLPELAYDFMKFIEKGQIND